MIISIIAAMGKNRVIGINNALPWQLPIDMKRFRQLTMGKPVIMGQKTFESMGKALPGRVNIVLTLSKSFQAPDCLIAHSIEEALQIAERKNPEETMIIGGESIYNQFLPLSNHLYLTMIEENFNGDAFFPKINYNEWEEIGRIENKSDENNPYKSIFLNLKRKSESR